MKNSKSLCLIFFICLIHSFKGYGEELDRDEMDDIEGEAISSNAYDENCWYASVPDSDCEFAREHGLDGIWFPEGPPIFRPFAADPRQITYSVGWRFNDNAIAKNVIDFSFGDILPIYRWCNIWYFNGDLELDLEGAVWEVFAPFDQDCPMVNADYYVGFPVSYCFGDWAFRLRGYHISCHVGDEFLVNHPHFHRKNPSTEYLDFYVSYQFTKDIRLYGGIGWLCLQDPSYRCGDWYAETGLELRLHEIGYNDYCDRMYGTPIFAMHFRFQSDYKHHVDATYILGYEWGKFSGLRRRFRLFLEYHDGYSWEGQFSKFPANYLSIRGSYGF
jgi:hypothetical protein